MPTLSVNIDHIATLRQARKTDYPDPAAAAIIAQLAGAHGIVAHLREDRRHINDRDIKLLKEIVNTKFILEMAATSEMIDIALDIRPDLITLVPEKRHELTTEGGLNLLVNKDNMADAVNTLLSSNLDVSIFIDPDIEQIKEAHKLKVGTIEIHTGTFCDAKSKALQKNAFNRIVNAAKLAKKLKLTVNAGHGICYKTIHAFKGLSEIDEFSIGHSIVSKASLTGMEKAVSQMLSIIKEL